MSFQNYKEAVELMERNAEILSFVGGCSNELIRKAEERLNLFFPISYKEFLLKFGALSFGSEEIYGIVRDDFDNSRTPDSIWYTLVERKEAQLPKNLLIIYDTGSEELFCLDFSKLDSEGEPLVVVFVPGVDIKYQSYEVIATDFGDFLLQRIKFELSIPNYEK